MTDTFRRIERARRRLGIRQIDAAAALGVTQGHYSKVVTGRTPPSSRLTDRINMWLAANDPIGEGNVENTEVRIAELAASIQAQCAELMGLTAARRR